jgi:serine/threonine-protein kinase RsbW
MFFPILVFRFYSYEMEGILTIETLQLSVSADLSNLAGIRSFVRTSLIPFCMDEGFLYDLVLAVEEAVTNIILHGYNGKGGEITVMIRPNAGSAEIVLCDDAPPFDLTGVPAPRLDLPLDQRPLGGLGLYQAGTRELLLDFSQLTFMSSSGLLSLHDIALLMRGQQPPDFGEGWSAFHAISHFVEEGSRYEKHVKLLNPQPRVRKTLETTGFDHILEIFDDRDAAIAAFQTSREVI